MVKKTKTQVVRLTKEEENLITTFRSYGVERALEEINTLIDTTESTSQDFLKTFRTAIKNDDLLTLDDLVTLGDLSELDAHKLLLSYEMEDSIAITGSGGAGKTRLLKALINSTQEDKSICLLDTNNEINPSRAYPKKSIVTLPTENLPLKDLISTALSTDLQRIVIADIRNSDDILTLLTSLAYKIPVIFTMTTEGNTEGVKDSLLDGVQSFKGVASDVIKGSDILSVSCYREGDSFKVKIND